MNMLIQYANDPDTLADTEFVHVGPNTHALKVEPPQVTSAPSNFAIITSAANIVLAAGEILFIQNLGTNPLFVKRGASASSSSFSYVLAAGTANDDGLGGAIAIDDFVGTVSFAGTSVRYNAWKR